MAHKYKEAPPYTTITKIRNILHGLSIFTFERLWLNPYPQIYSVRVECTEEDGEFGANGKGRNREYTLASAYAEFVERLQNGYLGGIYGLNRLFLKKNKEAAGFYYFPDEKILSEDKFRSLPSNYLNDIFGNQTEKERNRQIKAYFTRLKENGEDGVVAIPFYNVASNTIVYLPYNLTLTITGSNGMAAGNTPAEGIFQALCELIERYAVSQVYYKQLTPPTIPREFLKDYPEELSIIEAIENAGYFVEIKDFSAGLKLPAIGVLVFDKNKEKYKLNVGSETSFKRALSRALTEIYQGNIDKADFDNRLHDIPEDELEYFLANDSLSMAKRSLEIRKFIIDGSGIFPKSLFGENPSYHFCPDIYKSENSYKEEIIKLIKFFNRLGHDVLIRDVSFLGFPSYYVVIPNVSIYGRKTFEDVSNVNTLIDTVTQDALEDYFYSSDNFLENKDHLLSILNAIAPNREDIYSNLKMADVLKLSFKSNHYWSTIPVNYFLTIFCFVVEEYDNAIQYLQSYMKETNCETDMYYQSVLSLFQLYKKGETSEIKNQIPKEVIDDFADRQALLKYIDLPICPNCCACKLQEACQTKNIVGAILRISNQMRRDLRQENLCNLFDNAFPPK